MSAFDKPFALCAICAGHRPAEKHGILCRGCLRAWNRSYASHSIWEMVAHVAKMARRAEKRRARAEKLHIEVSYLDFSAATEELERNERDDGIAPMGPVKGKNAEKINGLRRDLKRARHSLFKALADVFRSPF